MGLWQWLFGEGKSDSRLSDGSTEPEGLRARQSEGKTFIELRCSSCHHSFQVGIDAGVLTSAVWSQGPSDSLAEQMRQHDESLGDPDDVASVSDPGGDLQVREFNRVLDSLNRREKRRWRCGNCGKIGKYSKRAIRVI